MGDNLKAQTARLRLSRSIKSWSACDVYLFMDFYGFWKTNIITTVGCRHHFTFRRNTICVKGTTCTAEGNVCSKAIIMEVWHLINFWSGKMHSIMRFIVYAHLEAFKANTYYYWISNQVTNHFDIFSDNLSKHPLILLPCSQQWITFDPLSVLTLCWFHFFYYYYFSRI